MGGSCFSFPAVGEVNIDLNSPYLESGDPVSTSGLSTLTDFDYFRQSSGPACDFVECTHAKLLSIVLLSPHDRHRPAIPIHDRHQVGMPLRHRDIGDVGTPDFVDQLILRLHHEHRLCDFGGKRVSKFCFLREFRGTIIRRQSS